ncbi:MAG: PAS domain S-box protein [Acidobacteriota bacterium]|nr:PAS domain S-box protein [Acidobacteriota bacterium]
MEPNTALFKSLFDSMTDAVIVADTQGRIVAVNPAAERVIGTATDRDPNAWLEFFDVYQADGQTPLGTEHRPIARALRGQTTSDFVFVLRPRDGKTKEVRLAASGYPLLADDGRILGGAVLLRSATDAAEQSAKAKQFEAELYERAQVLDAIVRSMGDGVIMADDKAQLTLTNPAAERIVGMSITDRPSEEWSDVYGLFHTDKVTPMRPEELPLMRAVRGETVKNQEIFVRNPRVPDGVYMSVNASPVLDESQNVVGGVGVLRDVSERKMEEEALAQAFAHGRLEVIDTLLHNIGNAINSVATGVDTLHGRYSDNDLIRRFNVLASLVGKHEQDWTTWLADDEQGRQVRPFLLSLVQDLNSEQEELRKTAARVRNRVRHIVDTIRTQASFSDGTVERTTVDLPRAVNDAVKVVQESLGRRGVAIEVDCSRAPDEILVQESRFQQMLVNLLKNAMEATDERAAGPENDPDWQPRIRLLAYRGEQEDTLVIDVVDNGIGIDPSRFRSVFNAGYTTKKSGSGLGLHSAANFVIGSGGSIRPLSDGIGRGATMRVTLRLTEPEEHR